MGLSNSMNSWRLAFAADGSKILSVPDERTAGYAKLMMSSDSGATWSPRDIFPDSSHAWCDGATAGPTAGAN